MKDPQIFGESGIRKTRDTLGLIVFLISGHQAASDSYFRKPARREETVFTERRVPCASWAFQAGHPGPEQARGPERAGRKTSRPWGPWAPRQGPGPASQACGNRWAETGRVRGPRPTHGCARNRPWRPDGSRASLRAWGRGVRSSPGARSPLAGRMALWVSCKTGDPLSVSTGTLLPWNCHPAAPCTPGFPIPVSVCLPREGVARPD